MDVSLFRSVRDTTLARYLSLQDVHEAIVEDDGLAQRTARVRAAETKRLRHGIKLSQLPVITLHGTMGSRKKDRAVRVEQWSGLVQVDLDDLPEGKTAEDIRDLVAEDPAVALAFVSPSGDGVKVAFAVKDIESVASYSSAFCSAQHHFREKYGLEIDATCKDDSRCCYLAHDANAVYRADWELEPIENLDAAACGAESFITDIITDAAVDYTADHKVNVKAFRRLVDADRGAVEGEGGDEHTLTLAMKGKDLGLTPTTILAVLESWNERCSPPWSVEELRTKIDNAFKYGSKEVGSLSIPDGFNDVTIAVDWQEKIRSRKGVVKATLHNLHTILANDRRIIPSIAWNDFAGRIVWAESPPWADVRPGTPLEFDSDSSHILARLSEVWDVEFTTTALSQVLIVVAQAHKFHPLRDAIAKLKWDGTPRLERLFVDYISGGGNRDYRKACARVLLISAVARAFDAGCKADQMVILEGQQGTFKSTALRVLFDPFFTEASAADLGSKDFIQMMQGTWVIELPELDGFSRGDANTVKSVLSRRVDTARMPYGRATQDYPRQCILIGSTNDSAYLRDDTGNRRYLPIKVREIAIEQLKADRDQLLAEAYAKYKDGTPWHLSGEIEDIALAEADKRRVMDPWQIMLDEPLSEWEADVVSWRDLHHYLKIRGAPRPSDSSRLSSVMQAMGWQSCGPLSWRRPE